MSYSAVPSPSAVSASALSPLDTNLPFATNLDTAIRQAQDLRKAGRFEDATRVLAQLVIASPDDPRVIGEYGKLMLEAGRLDDATSFLERAVVLQPSDWTLFSALGVAYDQSGRRDHARVMFQRALALSPNESTVLSNLAISHMLAGELDEAERLLVQASEQRKDIPGVAAKLAMVRNIRTTTGQSRPLSVSTLPQPNVPVQNSTIEAAPAEVPPAMDVAPMSPATPEPIEDEFESTPADDVETQEVAAAAPVLSDEASVDTLAALPITINEINNTSNVKHEPSAVVAESSQKSTPPAAPNAHIISSENKEVQQTLQVKNPPKRVSSLKALPASQRASVTAKVPAAEQKLVRPTAKMSPKVVAEAKRQAPKTAPVLEPIPAQVWVTESKLTQVTAVVPTPEAPKISELTANPTAQAAVMTRRAPAAVVVSRTAPVPLVLLFAPAPVSWESAVRVSLPKAHEAGSQPVVRDEPADPATSAASAGSWTDIVTGWVTAALGFITAFWA